MRLGLNAAVLALMTAAVVGAPSVRAEEPDTVLIGMGTWETLRSDHLTGELDLAYRSATKWWILHPHAGLVIAGDGDYYGYAGLLTDIPLTDHIVATWSEAFGGYGDGRSAVTALRRPPDMHDDGRVQERAMSSRSKRW